MHNQFELTTPNYMYLILQNRPKCLQEWLDYIEYWYINMYCKQEAIDFYNKYILKV